MVLVALVVILQRSSLFVAGQTPAARAARGTPAAVPTVPKTPWGHPDIQGIWYDEFNTPLERPQQYADREFLTEAERAALDAERSKDPGFTRPAERGTSQDVAGAYNAVFLSVKRTGRRTSLIVDPVNGRVPPLTAQAQERNRRNQELQKARGNRSDGPEDQSTGDRCVLGVTPDFNGFRRIVQGTESIAIGIDTGQGQGYQRVAYLTGSHPPRSITLRHGDSRGRVEGNSLVVETTNFSPSYPFRGAAENLKLVERFTRIDANTLEYAVTITDPTVWTAPWTVKQELKRQPDTQNRIYYEPRCHEGNHGLVGILIGARMDEKASK
jgi:hypothetical protein